MADKPSVVAISSRSDLKKNIPVVTVESFFKAHGEKLQLKLEGKRVGFDRKIREPTINRPGLAPFGFYNYFAEKRIQAWRGRAIVSEKSFGSATHLRFRGLAPKNSVSRYLPGRAPR